MALSALLVVLSALGTAGLHGGLVSIALALLPVPVYVLLVLRLDRFEKEPARLLAWTFVWGATGAVALSGSANEFGGGLLASAVGASPDAAFPLAAVFVAPLVEEVLKGAIVLALFLRKRTEFDGVVDGLIYGSLVGLGFAMAENIQYYAGQYQAGGAAAAGNLFVVRGLISGFSHPLYTSLTGIGLGLAVTSTTRARRIGLPLLGLAGAVTLHFLWNGSAMLDGVVFVAVYLLVMMPALGLWWRHTFRAIRREGELLRAHLLPDVEAGHLPADELDRLCTTKGRSRAVRQALRQGGVRAWRARRHFHQAAGEEGLRRYRIATGREDGEPARHDYLVHLGAPALATT